MIYYLGKILGRRFRRWYHNKYGIYYWGLHGFLRDGSIASGKRMADRIWFDPDHNIR